MRSGVAKSMLCYTAWIIKQIGKTKKAKFIVRGGRYGIATTKHNFNARVWLERYGDRHHEA